MKNMPALLSDVYGTEFGQEMMQRDNKTTFVKKKPQKYQEKKALGATASEDSGGDGVSAVVEPVVNASPTRREKDGNYEIHITIDRHDCHLLCLFIGVFTLSVIFNSNKPRPSSASN